MHARDWRPEIRRWLSLGVGSLLLGGPADTLASCSEAADRGRREPDVLLALEGVKELVSQFGADRVKKMVDLLS